MTVDADTDLSQEMGCAATAATSTSQDNVRHLARSVISAKNYITLKKCATRRKNKPKEQKKSRTLNPTTEDVDTEDVDLVDSGDEDAAVEEDLDVAEVITKHMMWNKKKMKRTVLMMYNSILETTTEATT